MRPIRPAIKFIGEALGDNLVGAEIGVWMGRHAQEICHYLKMEKLFLVDSWLRGYTSFVKSKNKLVHINGKRAYKSARRRLRKLPSSRFIHRASQRAVQYVENRSLDFVYIDADHSYRAARRDIDLWSLKVKVGGIVSGHDFGYTREIGVTNAVLRYAHKKNIRCYFKKYDWWFINE